MTLFYFSNLSRDVVVPCHTVEAVGRELYSERSSGFNSQSKALIRLAMHELVKETSL